MTYILQMLGARGGGLGRITDQGPQNPNHPVLVAPPGIDTPVVPGAGGGGYTLPQPPKWNGGGITPPTPPKPPKIRFPWSPPVTPPSPPHPQFPMPDASIPPSTPPIPHPDFPPPDTSIPPPPPVPEQPPAPSPEEVPADGNYPAPPAVGTDAAKITTWLLTNKQTIQKAAFGGLALIGLGVGYMIFRKRSSPVAGPSTAKWPTCVKFKRGRCLAWSDGWTPSARTLKGAKAARKKVPCTKTRLKALLEEARVLKENAKYGIYEGDPISVMDSIADCKKRLGSRSK